MDHWLSMQHFLHWPCRSGVCVALNPSQKTPALVEIGKRMWHWWSSLPACWRGLVGYTGDVRRWDGFVHETWREDNGAPASKVLARISFGGPGKPGTSSASLPRVDQWPDGRRENAAETFGEWEPVVTLRHFSHWLRRICRRGPWPGRGLGGAPRGPRHDVGPCRKVKERKGRRGLMGDERIFMLAEGRTGRWGRLRRHTGDGGRWAGPPGR